MPFPLWHTNDTPETLSFWDHGIKFPECISQGIEDGLAAAGQLPQVLLVCPPKKKDMCEHEHVPSRAHTCKNSPTFRRVECMHTDKQASMYTFPHIQSGVLFFTSLHIHTHTRTHNLTSTHVFNRTYTHTHVDILMKKAHTQPNRVEEKVLTGTQTVTRLTLDSTEAEEEWMDCSNSCRSRTLGVMLTRTSVRISAQTGGVKEWL